ncbi:hypothetical protein DPMN_001506 [Dreissena polymorpha]|uniref:Uncharacterized protein n=1 Tax=Dreissena polymorpha TaxID=45954 RepID=A0A9D4MLH5_DREPO|nr:hypothetical protein DPMN_001506 [Dreissena polymorpha]
MEMTGRMLQYLLAQSLPLLPQPHPLSRPRLSIAPLHLQALLLVQGCMKICRLMGKQISFINLWTEPYCRH